MSREGTKGAHMLLEKQEIFVGLNGINIGKENGMRAGLYNSPSPSQLRRKSLERRNSSRRRPNYPIFLVIVGVLFILGFWIVGLQQYPNPGTHLVSLLPTFLASPLFAVQSKSQGIKISKIPFTICSLSIYQQKCLFCCEDFTILCI